MSIKDKFTVKPIQTHETREWILKKHYVKRMPSISWAFGLFAEDLQGIITFGKPPSNALCIGILGSEFSDVVYELNRLVVNEGLEKNALSYFVAESLKLLPKPLCLVSYADTSQNHHGYIYQATNWLYTGLSAKRTERYDPLNPNKHSKTVTESKHLDYYDLAVRDRPQKHRYVYLVGNKKQKAEMLNNLNYTQKPYPKGENKRYDASYEPNVQMVLI